MSSIQELRRTISDLTVEENILNKKLKELGTDKYKVVTELRERLAQGETTGDRYVDMVIRMHGVEKLEELTAKYRTLEEQLKGKKGEFILIHYVIQMPHTFHSHGVDTFPHRMLRLAVLEGEEVVWTSSESVISNNGKILTLPTSQYLQLEQSIYLHDDKLDGKLETEKGPLFDPFHLGGGNDTSPPYLGLEDFTERGFAEDLVIGDEAVQEWLTKNAMPGLYKPAAHALSKLILEPTTEA